jgi:hypothetical protein
MAHERLIGPVRGLTPDRSLPALSGPGPRPQEPPFSHSASPRTAAAHSLWRTCSSFRPCQGSDPDMPSRDMSMVAARRRGRDSNPRPSFRRVRDFQLAVHDRCGSPPVEGFSLSRRRYRARRRPLEGELAQSGPLLAPLGSSGLESTLLESSGGKVLRAQDRSARSGAKNRHPPTGVAQSQYPSARGATSGGRVLRRRRCLSCPDSRRYRVCQPRGWNRIGGSTSFYRVAFTPDCALGTVRSAQAFCAYAAGAKKSISSWLTRSASS